LSTTEYELARQAVEPVGDVLRGDVGSRRTVCDPRGDVAGHVGDARLDDMLAGAGDDGGAGVTHTAEPGTPSIFQSTLATPEPGASSVPWTVTFKEVSVDRRRVVDLHRGAE